MKKNLLFAVCMGLTSLAFVACGDDDSTPANNAPQLQDTPNAAQAACFEIDEATSPISFVEFTETGIAVLEMPDGQPSFVKTRDAVSDAVKYIVGTFTWDGREYTVTVDGKVFCYISTARLSNGKYTISIRFPEQEAIEVTGTMGDKTAETDLTKDMCRSWKVTTTRIRHTGKVTGAKDFTGCDLNEILAYAKTKANIDENFQLDKVVTNVVFTRSGSFYIFYKNGENDYGTWQWKDQSTGTISYKWREANMGNRFESGEATFDVRTGKYCLTLKADIDDDKDKGTYNVSLTFYLAEN